MSESRQQRRARERAEQKAARGSGPHLRLVPSVSSPASVALNARVGWQDDPDDPNDGLWRATWTEAELEPMLLPNGQDVNDLVEIATFMEGDDLELLVAEVLGAIAQEWPDDDITVSWVLDEDAAEEAEELGMTFPTHRPRPS
ncbi:hypothetical protein IU447_15150 [Nocardia farcinica]|uniref:hypothetical protein n=1 Tax=Nocardia farcinica TaxID=37329 RepID=UPI001894E54C|nr:hypothetical protein [Nocardia farcinica]MBF6361454.1 hypothetical protein [Nocardia farcinica]